MSCDFIIFYDVHIIFAALSTTLLLPIFIINIILLSSLLSSSYPCSLPFISSTSCVLFVRLHHHPSQFILIPLSSILIPPHIVLLPSYSSSIPLTSFSFVSSSTLLCRPTPVVLCWVMIVRFTQLIIRLRHHHDFSFLILSSVTLRTSSLTSYITPSAPHLIHKFKLLPSTLPSSS